MCAKNLGCQKVLGRRDWIEIQIAIGVGIETDGNFLVSIPKSDTDPDTDYFSLELSA